MSHSRLVTLTSTADISGTATFSTEKVEMLVFFVVQVVKG